MPPQTRDIALTFPDIALTFPCSTHQEGVPNAAGDMRRADCDDLTRTSCKTFDICKAREPGINKNLAHSGELFGNQFRSSPPTIASLRRLLTGTATYSVQGVGPSLLRAKTKSSRKSQRKLRRGPLGAKVWVEDFLTEFAQRYDAQVCLDRVGWPSQLRNSDMPGAIQTNSAGRRRG